MTRRDCARARTLADSAPLPPAAADQGWLAEHRRDCEDCRADAALSELLAGAEAPLPPLDELTTRRLVDSVLEQAQTLRPVVAAPARSRRRVIWALSAAAALAVAALAITWLVRAPAPAAARLYLAAGDVRGANGQPARIGDTPSGLLRVGRGRAALGIGPAVRLRVDADTQLEVSPPAAREMSVRLLQGKVVASVSPARKVAFSVHTAAGRIDVQGTVFSVRADGGRVEVGVARGSVSVTPRAGAQLTVSAGQRLVLGEAAPVALAATSREQLSRAGSALDSLAPFGVKRRGLARLFVHSTPSGASVRLDGYLLGHTPVALDVRPGTRLLEVRLSGRQPIRERVQLRAGARVERDFQLSVTTASAAFVPSAGATSKSPRPAAAITPPSSPVPGATVPAVAADARRRRLARRRRARSSLLSPAAGSASSASAGSGSASASASTPTASGSGAPSTAQQPATPPAPKASAGELLRRARALRTARRFAEAATAYRQLIGSYGQSAQATAARVSLGYLLLDHLRQPKAALAAFKAYPPTGALAQEAAYGQIVALRALGRTEAQIAAMRAFVKRFPKALQRRRIARELRKIDKRR